MTSRCGWWTGVLLALAGSLTAGCGQEEPATIPGVEVRLDETRTLGEPVTVENLQVWPVYTDAPLDIGEFLTLPEAQEQQVAVIREVGGAGASAGQRRIPDGERPQEAAEGGATVDTLVIENHGDLPILVCAGTIVQGGKQDRQIGQDFVIAAKETVPVDAFCVEQGRWSVRECAREAEVLQFKALSSNTSFRVRSAGQYDKDQGAVWEGVRETLEQVAGSQNATQTLLEAVEAKDAEVVAARHDRETPVRLHFAGLASSERRPVGFAYAINGEPVSVRTFAHARLLETQFPAFLKTMAMEAQVEANEKATKTASAEDVVAFVESIEEAEETMRETRASNFNGYLSNEMGYGSRCYLRKKDRVFAVTQDWTRR